MEKKALIIANQQYQDDRFGELPGAAQDARQLADVLEDRAVGEFDVDLVPEGNARSVMKRIASFFGSAGWGDLLLLHLSCHGRTDDRSRELYFVVADTELDALSATGIPASFINEQAEHSRSTNIVLLLDCCYSGGFTRGLRSRNSKRSSIQVSRHFAGSGMAVITACSSLQFSYENEIQSMRRDEPSIFTSAVVGGLRTGKADLDGDGYISVHDLYQYAREHVTSLVPDQTPEFSVSQLNGTLYLARNVQSLYLGEAAAPLLKPTLYRAVTQGEDWERFGATMALDRMLKSGDVDLRSAAREALISLTRDADETVRDRAQKIWVETVSPNLPIGSDPRAHTPVDSLIGQVIGIDFGTTNSTVAIIEGGEPQVITSLFYSTITPSVVSFPAGRPVVVGELAKRQAALYPQRTIQSVKRKLGSDWSIVIDEYRYTAEDIAAYILERLRLDAETFLGAPVSGAVITVPANYGMVEREALQAAARIAGLRAFRFINEPTAAALAYGLGKHPEQTIIVFDLGGGTFDVSLLEVGTEDSITFVEVIATSGDNHLGGDDWDERLVEHLIKIFRSRYGVNLRGDRAATQKLHEAAERAKIELSEAPRTTISLPYIATDGIRPLHMDIEITREEFESITADLVERCREPFHRVLRDAKLKEPYVQGIDIQITHVVLVGGSTRMPAIKRLARELAEGKDPIEGVDPSAAIALGAAIQAGVLTGQVKDILLLDATSISLGIETKGGVFTKIIERNTFFPTIRKEIFTTAIDNQPSALVKVFQGESELTEHNLELVALEIADIEPLPRGIPLIEVTFSIDANGALEITAKNLAEEKEQRIAILRTVMRSTGFQSPNGAPELAYFDDSSQEEASSDTLPELPL